MSDTWSKRVTGLKGWVKENATNSEGQIDTASVISRVREAVAKVDREVDAEAIVTRVKEGVAKAETAIDREKVKQWIDDVDGETVKGWAANAKRRAAELKGGASR